MRTGSDQGIKQLMLDAFEEIGLEREFSLDLEVLKEHYDRLCRERHPDGGGSTDDFEKLRTSYEILKDPVRRLRHWLELKGKKPGVVEDAGTMRLFSQLGEFLSESRVVLDKKAEAKSALVASLAEREAIGMLAEGEKLMKVLAGEKERLLKIVAASGSESEDELEDLVEMAGRLVFLDKWKQQLRERWLKLGI